MNPLVYSVTDSFTNMRMNFYPRKDLPSCEGVDYMASAPSYHTPSQPFSEQMPRNHLPVKSQFSALQFNFTNAHFSNIEMTLRVTHLMLLIVTSPIPVASNVLSHWTQDRQEDFKETKMSKRHNVLLVHLFNGISHDICCLAGMPLAGNVFRTNPCARAVQCYTRYACYFPLVGMDTYFHTHHVLLLSVLWQ